MERIVTDWVEEDCSDMLGYGALGGWSSGDMELHISGRLYE